MGKSRSERSAERPCRTFWGSHGCKKQQGHSGDHICSCEPNNRISGDSPVNGMYMVEEPALYFTGR